MAHLFRCCRFCRANPLQLPEITTYLWADGQPSKAVTLEDISACVVHYHIGYMLLEGSLKVPLHFIQVLVILRAPLQLYLPLDGL